MAIRIRNKLVFLHHPRTGGSATSAALKTLGGEQVGDGQHNFYQANEKELTICTLRNPFDVLASWFHMSLHTDIMEFLQTYSHSEFTREGRLFYHADVSDKYLLYDWLQADFNNLLLKLRLRPTQILRVNTTSGKKPFMEYFTPEAEDLAREMFRKDFLAYQTLRLGA